MTDAAARMGCQMARRSSRLPSIIFFSRSKSFLKHLGSGISNFSVYSLVLFIACKICSGVMGRLLNLIPIALYIAFATAGAVAMVVASENPLLPKGPLESLDSIHKAPASVQAPGWPNKR